MCSRESICENKKDMDDSGFDMSAQDASMCIQRVNLLDLSDDVLLYILRHCTPRDLKALGYSCPRLGRLVRERSLWRRVDARSEGCTRSRFQWLLENVLHADTQVLLLTGYARDTEGCMGLVDITRKMAEQEAKQRDAESTLNGHSTLETITTNLANMRGMERHPARFYISAQRTQLRRHRCSPAWPEDGDGKEEGRAGPQRCIGPQYTVSEGLLLQLAAKCPQLTTLWLEYCNIDCSNTCLGAFPKSLKKLSLRGTKCYNMTFDKSFLFKVQDYLPILESLDVSECEWMDPASMLPLSKMPRLEELVMQDCHRLAEFVAYASLTARYGFKALKSLDLRGSPVGDSEVSALGWLPRLEKLWLSARCRKRAPPHSHFVDDERADHGLLPEWECQEPDYYKDKSDPFTNIDDIESGMGEPMTSSDIADDEPDSKNDRFRSQDAKGSKEDEKDKKGIKRKPDKGNDDDDTDDNGEPSPKHRRTGVKISFENNTITKRVLPVIQNEDGFCVFDESDEAYNGSGENIVIRNNVNENNADNNNEQRNRDNITPPNFEFNLINPMGSIDVGNVEIDFSLVNVDDLRENLRNDNNRNPDNVNNGNRNDNGVNEGRRRRASDDNRENPPNNDDRGCLVDCIKIDRLIDVSNAACDRQNEVIVIASSSRPTNEPSTSKQPDDNKKTENTKKPEPQGYVHFRRFQNPVYVNVNRDESDDNENEKIKENNGNRPGSVGDEIGKDCDNKIDDKMEIDENESEKGDDDKGKSDDAKPGTSDKQINEGASTSKDGQNAPKDKPPADNNPRVPFGPNNERRREPLPPVQYQIEQRHHVLYVGLGAQLNTYRFPRDSSELLRHLNLARTHLEGSGLVTDFAMRRFGRADGEDVNVIHIGPDGPMLVGQATGSRPDRSSLRFLSVTGYRNITDRSLVHLATAAPNLAFIDFSGTSVTEVGVESFRSLRPDCDIVYSQFNEHWPSKK